MAVGNVEIAVGQVWRCRDGSEHSVARSGVYPTFPWVLDDGNTVSETGRYHLGLVNHPLDLIELVCDEHGFTPWKGNSNPLLMGSKVFCRFENGYISGKPVLAEDLNWKQDPGPKNWRILAYKPADADEAAQPATTLFDSASLAEETLSALGWVFDGTTWVEQPKASLPEWDGVARIEMHEPAVSAPALLTAAAKHMNDRAATYDKPEGERSMAQTVTIFKAYHGIDLTEAQGWHFMQVLKDVRLFTREAYHADSAEDCIAYAALKAEAMGQEGGVA